MYASIVNDELCHAAVKVFDALNTASDWLFVAYPRMPFLPLGHKPALSAEVIVPAVATAAPAVP